MSIFDVVIFFVVFFDVIVWLRMNSYYVNLFTRAIELNVKCFVTFVFVILSLCVVVGMLLVCCVMYVVCFKLVFFFKLLFCIVGVIILFFSNFLFVLISRMVKLRLWSAWSFWRVFIWMFCCFFLFLSLRILWYVFMMMLKVFKI